MNGFPKYRAALLGALALLLAACGNGPQSGASTPAAAAPVQPAEPVADGDPRIFLASMMPGVKPEDLRPSPVPGLYELAHDGDINYVSADGRFVISGNLFQVTTTGEFPNLTEQRRRELRLQMLAEIPEKDMIVFGSPRLSQMVTVFTDVDCQWCQRMHSQVDEYNRLGIRVRYLAYPRSGPDSESGHVMDDVWCAKDRQAALTTAKQGGSVPHRKCSTPVAQHFDLGRRMQLTGTPGVLLSSGELIPGYLPPPDLLEAIKDSTTTPVVSVTP
jgi:thiol:disulfide interchange protein DsbC